MTINYLDSKRISGTTADREGATGVTGGWKELGRTTLGSDTSTIDVSSIPDKRYYKILMDYTQTSDFAGLHRLGNSSIDTGNNYHNRQSSNGGTDASSQATYVRLDNGWQSGDRKFAVEYIANKSDKEKLILNHMVRSVTTGAGQAPQRSEVASKWANTSNVLDKFQMMNGGTYADGSEVVVLGWDEDDTHTTNFWEELASVTTGSAGDTLQSGTISAKKYLWIQASYKNDGAADINALPRFNGDGGANYSKRTSTNGAADNARTGRTWVDLESGGQTQRFANMFIINNASNEKLCIFNQMDYGASGASTAPNRIEGVAKWSNTSDQITSIEWDQRDAGNYAAGAELKVWGSN